MLQCFVAQPFHACFRCVPFLVSSLFVVPHNLLHHRNIPCLHFSQIQCPACSPLWLHQVCSHYPLVPYSLILRFCLALWSVFLLAFNPRSLYILSGHGFSVYFRAPLAIIIPLLLFHEYYYHSYSTLMIKYFSCQLLSCRGRMEEDEMGCDD